MRPIFARDAGTSRRYRAIFISDVHLGNHDEALRRLIGQSLDSVQVAHDAIHETADGRRLLVTHGDVFDLVIREMRCWRSWDRSPTRRRSSSTPATTRSGTPSATATGSLSVYLKDRVKAAVRFIDGYERSLAAEARRREVAGVICGHVHKPEMRTIGGVLYVNDGDQVENCSALVEHMDGRLELIGWAGNLSLVSMPAGAGAPGPGNKKSALAA